MANPRHSPPASAHCQNLHGSPPGDFLQLLLAAGRLLGFSCLLGCLLVVAFRAGLLPRHLRNTRFTGAGARLAGEAEVVGAGLLLLADGVLTQAPSNIQSRSTLSWIWIAKCDTLQV
eukprot:jgi/Ulvmu1/6785/UM030_0123.1